MLYEYWEKYRRWLVAGFILLFLSLSYLLYHADAKEQAPLPLESPVYAAEASPRNAAAEAESNKEAMQAQKDVPVLYAEIKGNVKSPGMYQFLSNERVAHLIAKAGGLLPSADQQRVNLAQRLEDGISLYIPAKGEQATAIGPCNPSQATAGLSAAQRAVSPSPNGKININTATLQELQTLPGIGETRAQAILAYRQKNGPFAKPEQLIKVAGIGEKTYLRFKDKIIVN